MTDLDQSGPIAAVAWFFLVAGIVLLVAALMWVLDRLEAWTMRPPRRMP